MAEERLVNEEVDISTDGEYKVKKNRIFDHIAKVLAVLAAFLIWFYAVGTDSTLQSKTVTGNVINVTGVENGLSVIYGSGELADVSVKGRYSDVSGLNSDDINAYVDASGITKAGMYTLSVNVTLENGLTVESIYPEQITVYISVNQKKQIPVQVKATDYQIPAGCTLTSEIKSSTVITVEGPVDELDKISYAMATVSPGVISDSVTVVSKVKLYTADGEEHSSPYLKTSVDEVTVKVSVLKEKEIPLVVESTYGYFNDTNTKITVTPPTVVVRGEIDAVDALDSITVLKVDETLITEDAVFRKAIVLPEEIENLSSVQEVQINIEHISTTVKNYSVKAENIEAYNLPENKEFSAAVTSIKVAVRVDKNSQYYSTLSENDIRVAIDFSQITEYEGRYNLEASVTLKTPVENGKAYVLGSYYVPVSIYEKTAD